MLKKKVSTVTLLLAVIVSLFAGYWGANYDGRKAQHDKDLAAYIIAVREIAEYHYYRGEYNICYSMAIKLLMLDKGTATGACLGLVSGTYTNRWYDGDAPAWNWEFVSGENKEVQTP